MPTGPRQLAFPGMSIRAMRAALPAKSRQSGHTWDQIRQMHPEMNDEHGDAASYLAHAHDGDPEAENASVHDMHFEHRNIPLDRVRNLTTKTATSGVDERYTGLQDSRVAHANRGFQEARNSGGMSREAQDHPVPPILVVKRGRNYEVADGHHRSEAAKMNTFNTHINAVVGRSPHKTKLPKREY